VNVNKPIVKSKDVKLEETFKKNNHVEKTEAKQPKRVVASSPVIEKVPPKIDKSAKTNMKSSPSRQVDQNNSERLVLMTCCLYLFNLLVFWFSYDRLSNSMELMQKNHEEQMKMMHALLLSSEERTRKIEKEVNSLSFSLKNDKRVREEALIIETNERSKKQKGDVKVIIITLCLYFLINILFYIFSCCNVS
jgi:hypothetical protein